MTEKDGAGSPGDPELGAQPVRQRPLIVAGELRHIGQDEQAALGQYGTQPSSREGNEQEVAPCPIPVSYTHLTLPTSDLV